MQLIRSRAFYLAAIILTVCSIIVTRIPLFNYLGFEFSFVLALLAGFVSGIVTLSFISQKIFQRKNDFWRFIASAFSVLLVLICFPFFVAAANAVIVKNCSFADGMKFYLLLVLPAVLLSASLAIIVVVSSNRWRKTIFSVLYGLLLLHIPFVVYTSAQNFVYNPLVGFFPGFSYDETMQIIRPLIMYRILTVVAALLMVCIATILWYWKTMRRQRGIPVPGQIWFEAVVIVLIVPLLTTMFLFSDRLGFSSSDNFIRSKLGGMRHTDHIDIYYSTNMYKGEEVDQLAELHEFYYQQLCSQMHVAPSWRLRSFVYESPAQKGKLIGAAQTDITKPWLHQIHINAADVTAGLKHEMVHALAAEWNLSLFHVPWNTALIEGAAVALGDDIWYGEPLDRAVELITASGSTISPEKIFSSQQFFQSYSGISYAVAGSFCKYLIETYGIDKFCLVYSTGNITGVYGSDVPTLSFAWRNKIYSHSLTQNDTVKAKYYFRRSSIFQKDCARVLANLQEETNVLLARHEYELALRTAEQSLHLVTSPTAVTQKTAALFQLQKYTDVASFCKEQLADTALAPLLLQLHLRLGDAYWAMDSIAQAQKEYQVIASMGFGQWYVEGSALKIEALISNEHYALRNVLLGTMDDSTRVRLLSPLRSPIGRYLLAQENFNQQQYNNAIKILESFSWVSTNPLLEYFRLQLLGKSYFYLKEPQKAESLFIAAALTAPTESFRLITDEWKNRAAFSSR